MKKMGKVEKLITDGRLSPIMIGMEVLTSYGYEFKECGFGYNSVALEVRKDGVLVHREVIGE